MTPTLRTSIRWPGVLGALASVLLLGGGTWWATTTEISGAVIASGTVEVTGRPKSVQHLDGGIIAALHVREGDAVERGAPLVTLDDTSLEANLAIYRARLSEALATRDRLIAEQIDAPDISFAAVDPLVDAAEAEVHRAGQIEIFEARQELEASRRDRLAEKAAQFGNQITGVEALIAAKQRQIGFIAEEIAATTQLTERGLARASQLRGLQRNEAELLGQVAEHRSELARIQNSIRDTEIEVLQGRREITEDVVTRLRETTTSIEELRQQILTTAAQLDRVEIRAPDAGRIHEMQFTTLGGVVPPGGVILQIVPRDEGFSFFTRVDPSSIDQVFPGQEAKVLFPAFNQRTTPELRGQVAGVSATTSIDEITGQSYYRVEIAVPDVQLDRLGTRALIPGMPVEAYLTTAERTVLSYLVKPLSDQLVQAFREE
ncbi:HlyD family type I secretion periplasmic adaptor subunit [Sulfitobacter albidus]|uniref:Membrane fusion protein (MFP) family protein n=1 Tax=Sulfitobacter albidus TaxID=2829501 RepID=A0A975JFH0_9RHOB|nr:HlyD family type I secretion periplasmic adaptor subunit [Sulfitobacter albidus]QUJ77246.1 HlyD family type I secretion periplasmic adaptor subunit [Sulfitobacter albidus]